MAGVKQLVVCVLSVCPVKNWDILQFTGLTIIRLELKEKHKGVYLTVAKVVTVCHFLIRSQIEYDRVVDSGHVFIVAYICRY